MDKLNELTKCWCMIGKLSKDQKADWPKHLSELVHAYNSMKIGHHQIQPTLPDVWAPTVLTHWLLFPHDKGHERNTSMLTTTLLSYVNGCGKPSRKHKCSPHQRLRDRSGTMIEKLMPFHWNQATWSWLKLMPTRGRGKWRTSGRRNCMKWSAKLQKASLPTSWKTGRWDAHKSSTKTDFFSSLCHKGDPPLYSCVDWVGKVCHYHPGGANSEREWDWGSATKCELSATSPAPDRWDSSRLGKQEALHIPLDIFWSLLVGSRVKSLM